MTERDTRQQGFVVADGPHGRTMVVVGQWTDAASAAMDAGGVHCLDLNYAHGFAERSLDFISDWPVRRVDLLARTIADLSPLYRLAGSLEDLSVQAEPTALLDLSRLPWLVSLHAPWEQVSDSIGDGGALQSLRLRGYTEENLVSLSTQAGLRTLSLTQAPRLRRLTGVERLSRLTDLHVAAAQHLGDLSALSGHLPNLRSLRFETCGGINTLMPFDGRAGLAELWIANCGPIDSLRPLRGMSSLHELGLWESTRVADGDLTPLLTLTNLRDLRMMNRKHYRPSVASVKAELGI